MAMLRDYIDTNAEFPPVSSPGASSLPASARLPTTLVDHVLEWQDRGAQPPLLQQLDDRMLRDIGLNRSDVARECAKHFWQS
jgi:uncharacterized protein YjiS (DUF1127 family)